MCHRLGGFLQHPQRLWHQYAVTSSSWRLAAGMMVIEPPLLVSLRVGHQPTLKWVVMVVWGQLKAAKVNWIYSFHLFILYTTYMDHTLLLPISAEVCWGKCEADLDIFCTLRTGLLT